MTGRLARPESNTPSSSAISSSIAGGSLPTEPVSRLASSAVGMKPRAVSTTATVWPRLRSALTTCAAEARATSRSAEVPPVGTGIRIGSQGARERGSWGASELGPRSAPAPSSPDPSQSSGPDQLLQQIVPAHDPDELAVLLHQRRGALPGEHRGEPGGGGGGVPPRGTRVRS